MAPELAASRAAQPPGAQPAPIDERPHRSGVSAPTATVHEGRSERSAASAGLSSVGARAARVPRAARQGVKDAACAAGMRFAAAQRCLGALAGWLRQVATLVAKDLLAEWRGKEMLSATAVFAVLVLMVFTFAFDLRAENAALVAPGALWVAIAFAATLGLGRSMAQEAERGTLEGLLLCPVERSTLYCAKLAGNLIFTGGLELCLLPVYAVLFNVPVFRPALPVVLFLGTVGFVAAGTLFAAMAAGARAREILLPVLLLPIAVPVLIAAVKATATVLDGPSGGLDSLAAAAPWLKLLAGFDVLFVAAGVLAFEYVVEE
jgi:heme exporter protein B